VSAPSIVIRRVDKLSEPERFELGEATWPEVATIAGHLLDIDPDRVGWIRVWDGCVDIRLANARAVYRLEKWDARRDHVTCRLVYAENPGDVAPG
jgi:hypothetical protein